MRYISPSYKKELVEAKDIVTASFGEVLASIFEKSDSEAEVSTSAKNILKLFSKSE